MKSSGRAQVGMDIASNVLIQGGDGFAVSGLSIARWLFVTLLYAVLAPWLLLACFLCIVSFLPHEVWSFRETITECSFANSEAWKTGAVTWQIYARICFAGVCAARLVTSSVARASGRWIDARVSEWIDAHFSGYQQRRIGKITYACLLGGCVALGFAAKNADCRKQPRPSIESPYPGYVSTAAAIRLSTGRIVSGDATVSAAGKSGEFLVRFKDHQ